MWKNDQNTFKKVAWPCFVKQFAVSYVCQSGVANNDQKTPAMMML